MELEILKEVRGKKVDELNAQLKRLRKSMECCEEDFLFEMIDARYQKVSKLHDEAISAYNEVCQAIEDELFYAA